MCGITGWANLQHQNQSNFADDESVLRSMCAKMLHRGPDSEGVFVSEDAVLGMRRLAVIDVAHGEQPVFNEDKSIVTVMNGEIYNFRELRKELEKRGHKFNSNSDTEILPHLYEEYGNDFVKKANGMFALALWDVKRRRFLLARDRFGEKPLHYCVFDGKLLFASEIKVLLANPHVKARLNLSALRQYLAFDYVPAPLSIYEGIMKLPAANVLTLENGEIKIEKYWQMSFSKRAKTPSLNEASKELRDVLSNSVKSQMVADVPLGVLLSGGVDSSSVAAFAQQFSNTKVKTFSIGFEENSFDESHFARKVAAHLGTEHHEQILSVNDAIEILPEIAKWLDEPLSDASILPTFLLSKFARQSVTVVLGGDGGDELFAGYPMYRAHNIAREYEKIPRFLRRGFIENVIKNLPASTQNMSFDFKAKRFINSLENKDFTARHHSFFGSFNETELMKLLTHDVIKASDSDIYGEARNLLQTCDAASLVEKMQFLDSKFYLAEGILAKVDRASMANSLEVRAPFLDHRVAEFAASLPENYKLKGREGKFILKRAVAPMLPDFVTKRPKKGFGIPVAEWLKGKMKPLLNDMLSPRLLESQGLFDVRYVRKILREHESGAVNNYKLLWTLLVFQLWYQKFLKP